MVFGTNHSLDLWDILNWVLQPAYIEHFPTIYNSKTFKELKQFVRSKHFEYIIMGMLLANLVTVIIETTVCSTSSLIVIFCAFIGSW